MRPSAIQRSETVRDLGKAPHGAVFRNNSDAGTEARHCVLGAAHP